MEQSLNRCLVGMILAAAFCNGPVFAQDPEHELNVHLVQANNNSPYAFVRAKFEPGEISDPWAVRFFDQEGKEVSYFVWDAVTWNVAREGRADWGNRYAILNHHPGNSPEALEMRPRRLEAARPQLPALGEVLTAQDEAAKQWGDSICCALYLVRHSVAPLGKDKLKLLTYAIPQIEPRRRTVEATRDAKRLTVAAGELVLTNLPDRISVSWKGKKLFRYAGFRFTDKSAAGPFASDSHADPAKPFVIEIEEGIITRLSMHGHTNGRADSPANWQCTYWLFPEGSYVALTGFSLDNTEGYLGGSLSMALWQLTRPPREVHAPLWEKPWSLFEFGESAFVAVHQFPDTPLTVGYGNNPFNVSTPASFQVLQGEKTKGQGDGLIELNWTYELTDNRVYRLFHPRLDGFDRSFDLASVTDLRETLLGTGKLTNVPLDAVAKDGTLIWPASRVRDLEEALSYVKWRPRDWLYRQYLVAVGDSASEADQTARQVLGAAAGWLDRPFAASDIADLIVHYSLEKSRKAESYQQVWTTLPGALNSADHAAAAQALQGAGPIEFARDAMERIRKHVAAGGDPIQGTTKDGGEGWHGNPAYAASDVPVSLRFLDHFQLYDLSSHTKTQYRESLLRWAEFSLETLGGRPLDWDRLRTSLGTLWPNRVVMLVPLMLRSYRETGDEKYARVARLIFDDLFMSQVETNPQGYFWAWGKSPLKAESFDLNYNVAAYDRGLIDYWSERQLDIIGQDRAEKFAAAQARYLAISGQLLDTFETDSMTAIQSQYPGAIPFAVGQAALLLYDDYAFYRGLVGDLIRWSVIDDGATVEQREGRRNFYSMKIGSRGAVFWAYGIGEDPPSRSQVAEELRARWLSSKRPKSKK